MCVCVIACSYCFLLSTCWSFFSIQKYRVSFVFLYRKVFCLIYHIIAFLLFLLSKCGVPVVFFYQHACLLFFFLSNIEFLKYFLSNLHFSFEFSIKIWSSSCFLLSTCLLTFSGKIYSFFCFFLSTSLLFFLSNYRFCFVFFYQKVFSIILWLFFCFSIQISTSFSVLYTCNLASWNRSQDPGIISVLLHPRNSVLFSFSVLTSTKCSTLILGLFKFSLAVIISGNRTLLPKINKFAVQAKSKLDQGSMDQGRSECTHARILLLYVWSEQCTNYFMTGSRQFGFIW